VKHFLRANEDKLEKRSEECVPSCEIPPHESLIATQPAALRLTQFSGCCVLCIHSQADDFVHINHRGRAATKIMVQQEETARAWRGEE